MTGLTESALSHVGRFIVDGTVDEVEIEEWTKMYVKELEEYVQKHLVDDSVQHDVYCVTHEVSRFLRGETK